MLRCFQTMHRSSVSQAIVLNHTVHMLQYRRKKRLKRRAAEDSHDGSRKQQIIIVHFLAQLIHRYFLNFFKENRFENHRQQVRKKCQIQKFSLTPKYSQNYYFQFLTIVTQLFCLSFFPYKLSFIYSLKSEFDQTNVRCKVFFFCRDALRVLIASF